MKTVFSSTATYVYDQILHLQREVMGYIVYFNSLFIYIFIISMLVSELLVKKTSHDS